MKLKNNKFHLFHISVSREKKNQNAVKESHSRSLNMVVGPNVGKLQTRETAMQQFFYKYVGRLLYLKFKTTKSWLKAVTKQLCIHKIKQQQLSSLDLSPTALTHPGSSLLIWKVLGSTLKETTKLYSSSGLCDSACETAIKIIKNSEMTEIFRNQLHPICNRYADSIKIIFHSLKAGQQES